MAPFSDCGAVALVTDAGSVDWLCLPHFDDASVLSWLLDEWAGPFPDRPYAPRHRTNDRMHHGVPGPAGPAIIGGEEACAGGSLPTAPDGKCCPSPRPQNTGRAMAPAAEGFTAPHPGRGAQQLDPGDVPRVPVTDIVRSLQFYLDELGCVVREVADGWVLLRSGPYALRLVHQPQPDGARHQPSPDPQAPELRRLHWSPTATAPIPPPLLIRLSTPDLRALRRRLGSHGVPAGPVSEPVQDSADEIELCDPDQHDVVISQLP